MVLGRAFSWKNIQFFCGYLTGHRERVGCSHMGLGRWNVLASDKTGVHLLLLPMLLGFFTYKIAVIAKQTLILLGELSSRVSTASNTTSSSGPSAFADEQKGNTAQMQ